MLIQPPLRSGPEDGWTEHLVRRMFKESGDPMQRMLRMLAEADGEEVSTNEIAAALDLRKGARRSPAWPGRSVKG